MPPIENTETSQKPKTIITENRMLRWFAYTHLPEHLQPVSKPFAELAVFIDSTISPGPEQTVALRKLLEAKDAAVRAALHPGGQTMLTNYYERRQKMQRLEQPANKPNDIPLFLRLYVSAIAVLIAVVHTTAAICTVALMILGTVRLFKIYG